MSKSEQKVLQYLNEAHATEVALVRVLQAQIAMAPRGSYRTGLERHLDETRKHAERVDARREELGKGSNPLQVAVAPVQRILSRALALGKAPADLIRGSGGDEKVLKNAKDACATESLEIATYMALEHLARSVGDETTAKLAASIRADEEKMLERVMREIPKLTEAVVRAEVNGDPAYDVTEAGAADGVRAGAEETKQTTRKGGAQAKRAARHARKVPGVAQAEGQVKGAVASDQDLPIARYDELNADEINRKLSELSQIDIAKVDSYERKNENRSTVLTKLTALRGDEPWPGYDELTVAEITSALAGADEQRTKKTREYERSHKDRDGVLDVVEREPSTA